MRPDRPEHLAGDGAIATLGEGCDGLGEVGRNTRRDRDPAFGIYAVYVVHI
jgi:hypothetical protein